MSRLFILLILLAAFSESTNGQDHSHMNHPADSAMIMSDTSMPGMDHSMHHEHKMGNSPMSHSLSLN
ncbi:MAG TPA: hypothetical protein VFV08_15990, partial [Puia sp.]|nr:hypothetical protein [Puia sp.]